MRSFILTFALMAACAGQDLVGFDEITNSADVGTDVPEIEDSTLRIDVSPSEELDAQGFLPQTFDILANSDVALDLLLSPAVSVSGLVTAYDLAPTTAADLPGQSVPMADALVSIRNAGTFQSANDVTGEAGDYSLFVVPGTGYEIVFLPDDPLVPFRSISTSITKDTVLDVDLGYGSAVWGTVVDEENDPVAGVAVRAVDVSGNAGTEALTDESGFYTLRVDPGTYTLVSEGRSHGRDPVLTSAVLDVPTGDIRQDFAYGSLELATLTGRAVDFNGQGLAFHTVKFLALELYGYDESATWTGDAITNSEGNIDSRLLPGVYQVEILADADEDLTSVVFDVSVDQDIEDIGTVELASTTGVQGTIADPSGEPVPHALLAVAERGLSGRTWQTTTDENGQFELDLPRSPVAFTLTPPGTRSDLAITRVDGDVDTQTEYSLAFVAGAPLMGTVHYENESGDSVPSALSIVEALDSNGERWGVALTDSDGNFTMQVAWPQ